MSESSLIKNARYILKVMVEKGIMSGQTITVRESMHETKIPKRDFDVADTYLLQKEYVKGTMGG